MTALTCHQCAHFKRTAKADWGRCKAPLPPMVPKQQRILVEIYRAKDCPAFVKTEVKMTEADLMKILRMAKFYSPKTIGAMKAVVIEGKTRAEASRLFDLDQAIVTRCLQKVAALKICPTCGQQYRVGPGY